MNVARLEICWPMLQGLYQVYELCEKSDIVLLQETLLFPYEPTMLSTTHQDFEDMGVLQCRYCQYNRHNVWSSI